MYGICSIFESGYDFFCYVNPSPCSISGSVRKPDPSKSVDRKKIYVGIPVCVKSYDYHVSHVPQVHNQSLVYTQYTTVLI